MNLEEAVSCYEKAADKDDPEAKTLLAGCYEFGRGVQQDLDKARELYEEAADAGYEMAEQCLARLNHPEQWQTFAKTFLSRPF